MSIFKFKQFSVYQNDNVQKIGTDAMILGALATSHHPKNILDIGTGTGVLLLMMAQKYPSATIHGIDILPEAIELTQRNVNQSNFPNQFKVHKGNFLTAHFSTSFDLIVTNPPYFNSKMPPAEKSRSISRHEESMSLSNLTQHATKFLSKNGMLWLILPAERASELIKQTSDLHLIHRIEIFGKPNKLVREILVFSKERTELVEVPKQIVIREESGDYTSQYKKLTVAFHFNNI